MAKIYQKCPINPKNFPGKPKTQKLEGSYSSGILGKKESPRKKPSRLGNYFPVGGLTFMGH